MILNRFDFEWLVTWQQTVLILPIWLQIEPAWLHLWENTLAFIWASKLTNAVTYISLRPST